MHELHTVTTRRFQQVQQKKSIFRGPLIWLVILVLVVVMSQMLALPAQTESKEISYSEFLELVRNERIAQLVITPVLLPELVETDHLDETARGSGGFGSTGKK